MNDLRFIGGYTDKGAVELPPTMTFRRMFHLGLKTWPFMRPMLKHLLVLLALLFSGGLTFLVGAFFGTDLFYNKVLIGEKLQPIQATVLFLGEEYVTTDPLKLGKKSTTESTPDDKNNSKSADVEPELTKAQRKTVRNRFLVWSAIGGVLIAVFGAAAWYYSTWVWQSINQNLRVAMVERAESLSLRFHNDSRVGDAIFRVYQDSAMIINLLEQGVIAPLRALYGILLGLAFATAFDPWIALIIVLVGVPIGWLAVASTPRIRRRALANRIANSNLTSRLQEAFAAIKVVKANRAEARIFDRFDQDSIRALNAAYFLRLDMVLLVLAVALLGGGMFIAIEYITVSWVIDGRETFLGALVAAFIGFVVWNVGAVRIVTERMEGLAFSARRLLEVWMRMQDLFIALERAFYLLDQEPEVVDPVDPVRFPSPIGRVTWRGIQFAYETGKPVLRDIDLDADAGTVTAIVGATGTGKSTLMTLLLRLYDPEAGSIAINGVDLKGMAIDDIRANVTVALQKNVLFADTVANNISLGTPGAQRADIEAAARIACADTFIETMPKGYDTELGERGGKLSSGQRQRLSIARAVVRDTPILILDEPTASLDARTEQQVLKNLADWGRGRVIFVITHRLSTIRNADQIALIDGGRIVERGAHDALMAIPDGRYRAFVGAETEEQTGSRTGSQSGREDE
ncbi:MAG: ABC transporter ATP-binding protein [Gammaproteobacteria bacterium]|nr:ABC transporter ATP-binding protein [Gammaproteobacteria bacterium]